MAITILQENEDQFRAVLDAFANATDNDVIPISKFEQQDGDSTKRIKISCKVHVEAGKRLRVRDQVADYLGDQADKGQLDIVDVTLGTKSKPDKETLDVIVRENPTEVIRIAIKPINSGGSGGGSAATTVQETALATFLAMRYDKGAPLECHPSRSDGCIDEDDYIKGLKQVDCAGKVTVEEIMGLDASWKESCIKGANKIAAEVQGSNWVYVRGDSTIDDGAIKKAFARVKKKSGLANEDKWNPSDIWMVQKNKKSEITNLLDMENTIDCLNNYIALAFSDKGWPNKSGKDVTPKSLIGISLKKLGPNVNFTIMNAPGLTQMQKAQNISFQKTKTLNELTAFSAMDVYILMSPNASKQKDSFQCRNFAGQSAGDWKLELKGEYAAQGKIQGKVMRELLTDAKGFPAVPQEPNFSTECKESTDMEAQNFYAKQKGKKMSQAQANISEEIYTLLKKYCSARDWNGSPTAKENMLMEISTKDTSWRYSKLAGLRLLDWICKIQSVKERNRACKEMYLYASSQTEKSSTYYKLY